MATGRDAYYSQQNVTSFERLTVSGFRQFGLIDLNLSNQLTVLTGANGAGKTTLLGILGSHFNWHTSLLANPRSRLRTETGYRLEVDELDAISLIEFLGVHDQDRVKAIRNIMRRQETKTEMPSPGYPPSYPGMHNPAGDMNKFGELSYQNGKRSELLVPKNSYSLEYSVNLPTPETVHGVYLSSHRTLSSYQRVAYIPAEFAQAEQILSEYTGELRASLYGVRSDKNSMTRMKEALLAAALYGDGNNNVRSNPDAHNVWHGFQDVLSKLFPATIGFIKLASDPPEIVIETRTGDFTVDSLSGGLSAIFELAWQIHLRASSSPSTSFTVCFDEPENHLHPSLQRTLIPSLLRAFPNVSFVIATHSPFIISAARDAAVYALQFTSEGKVASIELDFANKAKSAERVLTDVLGVSSTSPIWAEDAYNAILERFSKREMSRSNLLSLKSELEENGLGDDLPLAINALLNSAQDGN